MLIVIDGPIGVGKTTAIGTLVEALRYGGIDVHHTVAPSKGPIGTFIRELLKRPDYMAFDQQAISHLYVADRFDQYQREIGPALDRGQLVISDRYYHAGMALNTSDWSDDSLEHEWLKYKLLPRPDLAIIITATPMTIWERQQARQDTVSGRKILTIKEIAQQVKGYNMTCQFLRCKGENIRLMDSTFHTRKNLVASLLYEINTIIPVPAMSWPDEGN